MRVNERYLKNVTTDLISREIEAAVSDIIIQQEGLDANGTLSYTAEYYCMLPQLELSDVDLSEVPGVDEADKAAFTSPVTLTLYDLTLDTSESVIPIEIDQDGGLYSEEDSDSTYELLGCDGTMKLSADGRDVTVELTDTAALMRYITEQVDIYDLPLSVLHGSLMDDIDPEQLFLPE